MTFSPMGFLLKSLLAERAGVADPQAQTRLALFGELLGGSSITGLALTAILARREAEDASEAALIRIPNVEDLSVAEAQQRLESLGLKVATRGVYSKVPKGFVTSQRPEAYYKVARGATVTLYVSKGMYEPPLVELPNVVGQNFEDAQRELYNRHFQLQRINEDNDQPAGQVIAQDPNPGRVRPQILVTLTVSNGQPNL